MLGIDCSKYTSPRDMAAMQRLKDAGIGMAIIQAHPAGYGVLESLELMRSCQAVGLPWDAYIYGYCAYADWCDGALQTLDTAGGEGLVPMRLWYDIEDVNSAAVAMTTQQRVDAYNRDLAKIDSWSSAHSLPVPGVYSGRWYFDAYLQGVTAWAGRDLWDAHYDSNADNGVGFAPYGGWQQRAIKQYMGTSSVNGVNGLDQNVLSEHESARFSQQPAKDDCSGLVNALGYIAGDAIKPLRGYKLAKVQAVVAEIDRVAAQYGIV